MIGELLRIVAGNFSVDKSDVDAIPALSDDSVVNGLINGAFTLIGLICVVMIIVGGIRYMTSQGDSGTIAKAKNTILYAIIGLVVTLFAFVIVNFVIEGVTSGL